MNRYVTRAAAKSDQAFLIAGVSLAAALAYAAVFVPDVRTGEA